MMLVNLALLTLVQQLLVTFKLLALHKLVVVWVL